MGYSISSTKECKNYVCIDLETSGGSIHDAEIIEIGAVKVEDGEILDCYTTLVKPYNPVNKYTFKINGISDDDLIDAPSIDDVFDDFLEFIGDGILLGHNISAFDLQLIRGVGMVHNKPIENKYIDTLNLSIKLLPNLPSHSLTALCEYYNIENTQAHRALNDCYANIQVYNAMIREQEGNINNITKRNGVKSFSSPVSDTTRMLIRLTGIIEGIICDGSIEKKEIEYLQKWLNDHSNLKGNYQYDVALQALSGDKDITSTLASIVDPIENNTETVSEINLSGKIVCITGEFESGTRNEIEQRLSDLGAEISPSVVKMLDYLIVGGQGSTSWSCGNYGTKVKKALEMQEKGRKVKIIRESDIFRE